jgi:hypothetical protein
MNADPNPDPQGRTHQFTADVDGVKWMLRVTETPEKILMTICSSPPGAMRTAAARDWLVSAMTPWEGDRRPALITFRDTGFSYVKLGRQPEGTPG